MRMKIFGKGRLCCVFLVGIFNFACLTVGMAFLTFNFVFAGEEYQFEKMWPVLEQPWYFNRPSVVLLTDLYI